MNQSQHRIVEQVREFVQLSKRQAILSKEADKWLLARATQFSSATLRRGSVGLSTKTRFMWAAPLDEQSEQSPFPGLVQILVKPPDAHVFP